MTYVRTEDVEPGIRIVTLDKPDRLNAIDFDGVRELHTAGFARGSTSRPSAASVTRSRIA